MHNKLTYFGTDTSDGVSQGIYHCIFDVKNGGLSDVKLSCKLFKPSFLVMHPKGKVIYSVTGDTTHNISALRIDANSQKLQIINSINSGGDGPCHLAVSTNAKNLYVANYISGSVSSISINNDGSLGEVITTIQHSGCGPNKQRQGSPHVHSVNLSFDNRFAYVADLGVDKLFVYKVDQRNGGLLLTDSNCFKSAPGSGPRHFTFHPNGQFAYLINELSNTIVIFNVNKKDGSLSEVQIVSTLPDGFDKVSYTAEVKVHPNGKYLYGSNRGHDSIVIFKINQKTGALKLIGFQADDIDEPRHFNIDSAGNFCVVGCQNINKAVVFKINKNTGELTTTDNNISIGKPICIQFS